MGEVYRAMDTRLNRTVAIKVLPAEISSDPDRSKRLRLEARALSSLNHPNICALYDVGRQDGVDFLVMEYLDGKTLADRLIRGPLPIGEVLRYGIEIAGALDKAHGQGLIHRDLKPGNVMLTKAGAKLLDFGLVKMTENPSAGGSQATVSMALSEEGALLGTLQYMSPEQIEGKEAGPRSDIFTLGLVLYEMVTGRRAFAGSSHAAIAAAILSSEPQPMRVLQPATPRALEGVIKACLAKQPDERWQSAHDLRIELKWMEERLAEGVPAQAVSPRAWRTRLMEVAGILLVATVIAATLVTHYRSVLPPQRVEVIRSSLLPPEKSAFLPYNFAVSPDGSHVAFVAVGADGRSALWVRALSNTAAQQLNGTDEATFPFWSPENRRIGFFADGKLKTVDAAGGAVEILCDALIGRGGTWNREGTIVFAPFIAGPLYRISADGGTATPVTTVRNGAEGEAHRWPFFLPDGKHFLYFKDWSDPADPQGNGIYAGSLEPSQSKLISLELTGNVAFASGNLLYVRDRSLVTQFFNPDRLETSGPAVPIAEQELEKALASSQSGFAVSQNGELVFQSATDAPTRLVWFDAGGKELGQLSEAGYKDPSLSPDGRYVAVSSDDEHNGKHFIRVYDLARGISTRLTNGGSEEFPTWTRDGKEITYVATAGKSSEIETIAADGSGPPHTILKGAEMFPSSWSADGHLAFLDLAKGRPYLTVYFSNDHKVTQLPLEGPEAQFSPDGKWIVSTESGNGVHGSVFVEPFPGPGARVQISSGGAQPRWSRDGKHIFYIAPDRKLMAVSFDSGKGSASAPHVLFQTRIVAPDFALFQYDVAPDGRFLINSFPASYSSPLTLLTGWHSLMKQR